jgi:Na+/proline symporter
MFELPVAAASAGVITGVVLFLAISAFIGIFSVKFVQRSSRRFIVAGKSLPLVFVGTMLTAQAVDGNSSLGNAAFVYDFGFWAGAVTPIGLGICLLLTGFLFGRPLNRMSLMTLPDFYYRRYGQVTEGLSGILMMVSFIILVAGNFAASGFILELTLGVDFVWGMFIAAGIVMIYTMFGGLFSSAYTDIFQIYLAIFGFWAAFFYFALGHGGPSWGDFMNNTPEGYFSLEQFTQKDQGALLNWSVIIALGIGDLVALDFMERVFAAKNGRTASRGAYWGAALTFLTVIPTSFMGIWALTFVPEIENSFLVYPTVAIEHAPAGIAILLLSAVLGASMSTANGGILAISAVISRNIIQRDIMVGLLKREHMGNRMLLLLTRIALIPVVGVALYVAWKSPQPGKYLALAFDVVLAGCLVPLLGGLFWSKSNRYAAIASIVIGSLARMIGYFYFNGTWGIFEPSEEALSYAGIETMIPPIISLVVFVTVALLTQKREPGEYYHGVIDYIPPEEDIVLGQDLKDYKPPAGVPKPAHMIT